MKPKHTTVKDLTEECSALQCWFVSDVTLNILLQSFSQAFGIVLCMPFKHAGLCEASLHSL